MNEEPRDLGAGETRPDPSLDPEGVGLPEISAIMPGEPLMPVEGGHAEVHEPEQAQATTPEAPADGGAETQPSEAEAQPPGPSVAGSSSVMALGTMTSRVTGVARDMAMVAALGFGTLADTFAIANSLPMVIYMLVVGGALNAVFVPQLVRHMKHDSDGGHAYADRLLTLAALILLALSIAAVVFAPVIVRLYATGAYSPRDFEVAVAFARLCLPQIFFFGIYTLLSQVLNARNHFAMPMFAPILNNVVVIAVAGIFLYVAGSSATTGSITSAQITLLGLGTTIGVMLQALILVPVLIRTGYAPRPAWGFRGYGIGKAGMLAGWAIALVLVNQLAFLVVARLATRANVLATEAGVVAQGLTTYQKAYLVFMLPQSVITISIATALLPRMSRSAAARNLTAIGDDLNYGTRLVASLIVPASAALIVLGPAITTLVFGFGAGKGDSATYTGFVVSAFAIGLLPSSLYFVLLRGWYALEDTRTPFYTTVVLNIVLLAITLPAYLVAPVQFKVLSLGLSYAVAYWFAWVITWFWIRRDLAGVSIRETGLAVLRMLVAGLGALAAGAIAAFAVRVVAARFFGIEMGFGLVGHPLLAALTILVGSAVILGVYLLLGRLLLISEITSLGQTVRTRLRRS